MANLRQNACIRVTPRRRSAFTLTELVVAIGVVALLIGILMPSLAGVREHARRVVCGSNLRQIGLGVHMYADQSDSQLPASVFLGDAGDISQRTDESYRPQDMVTVRIVADTSNSRQVEPDPNRWDGLGLLFAGGYLSAPQVYYCPSHRGEFRFEEYADHWTGAPGEIVSNYHFRGQGPNQSTRLHLIDQNAAIVSDSLRSLEELNHEGGLNVLSAGLSVSWLADERGTIASILSMAGGDGDGDSDIADRLWGELDGGDIGGGGTNAPNANGG
ncbi:MAG: DUF1559 domain-containing protein [Phycisphaerales bacterium]